MPRQCAVIDVLADEAFAQELVDRTDGGLSAYRIEQPFGRKSFRGEKSKFRRKPRREFGLLARASIGRPNGRWALVRGAGSAVLLNSWTIPAMAIACR